MKLTFLWQGYHGRDIVEIFRYAWNNNHLLICCPPTLNDFSFTSRLPDGAIEFIGSWEHGVPEDFNKPQTSPEIFPDDPVLGVFTSGTTRDKPKLILYSKKNILSCQKEILALYERRRIDNIFCMPQPYHVFGLLLGYVLSENESIELLTPAGKYCTEHLQAWTELVGEKTLTLLTPTQLRDLAGFVREHQIKVKPSYSCILGGARVLKSDWLTAKTQLAIDKPSIGYGCSEASPGITHLEPGIEPQEDGEIGQPLAHLEVNLLNERQIEVIGESICLATIENGQLDFPTHLLVSDTVAKRPDGRLVFNGRSDVILNRGGEKFSLEHMENMLKERHGIEAVCVALENERLGQELGIVAKSFSSTTKTSKTALYETLEEVFGRKFSQSSFKEVSELPLNANAKIDRKQAQEILS